MPLGVFVMTHHRTTEDGIKATVVSFYEAEDIQMAVNNFYAGREKDEYELVKVEKIGEMPDPSLFNPILMET
jgi:hypothetical protein